MSASRSHFRRASAWLPLLFVVAAVPAVADGRSGSTAPEGGFTAADALHLHIQIVQLSPVSTNGEPTAGFAGASTREIIDTTERALKQGTATERYVFDSPVVVGHSLEINEGAKMPFVRGQSKTDRGEVNTSVAYEDVGCKIQVQAEWSDPADRSLLQVSWGVSISAVDTAGALTTEDATAPVFSREAIEANTLSRPGEAIAFRLSSAHPSSQRRYTTVLIARLTQNDAEAPQR